jgi:hypothetical protein
LVREVISLMIRTPRSAVSRPRKQKAPSSSNHQVRVRAALILRTVARGSVADEVARDRAQRSFTSEKVSSVAPSSREDSPVGSSTAVRDSSAALAGDRDPVVNASLVAGRSASWRPRSRVFFAWATGTPSSSDSRAPASWWPDSVCTLVASIRGARRVLQATTRRSTRTREV